MFPRQRLDPLGVAMAGITQQTAIFLSRGRRRRRSFRKDSSAVASNQWERMNLPLRRLATPKQEMDRQVGARITIGADARAGFASGSRCCRLWKRHSSRLHSAMPSRRPPEFLHRATSSGSDWAICGRGSRNLKPICLNSRRCSGRSPPFHNPPEGTRPDAGAGPSPMPSAARASAISSARRAVVARAESSPLLHHPYMRRYKYRHMVKAGRSVLLPNTVSPTA